MDQNQHLIMFQGSIMNFAPYIYADQEAKKKEASDSFLAWSSASSSLLFDVAHSSLHPRNPISPLASHFLARSPSFPLQSMLLVPPLGSDSSLLLA